MEIRHLQAFVIAAETESFSQTAEKIGVTPSAVSQHVSSLETELSRRLFERTGNSISLTDFGKSIHKLASEILAIVDQIKDQAGLPTKAVGGEIKIASSRVPAEWLLPELLIAIRETFPDIQESVRVSDSAQAIAEVEASEADFALVGELPRAANLCAKRVADDKLVLVASRDHPLAEERSIEPERLLQHNFIFRETGSGSRRCVENKLASVGITAADLKIPIEVNSNDAIRAAVERGVGIAFLSRNAILNELETKRLVEIGINGIEIRRYLYLVTNPERLPNPTVRAALQVIETFRSQSADFFPPQIAE